MSNQNFFLPVCGSLIFLFVLIVAIIGMRSRLRFAKRLFSAYKNKSAIKNWGKYKNKHQLLLLVALVSILGILFLSLLILTDILNLSNILLLGYVVLILSCMTSGILLLIDLEKLIK
jgi:hypothetical protein